MKVGIQDPQQSIPFLLFYLSDEETVAYPWLNPNNLALFTSLLHVSHQISVHGLSLLH
jgi:hypothetical protein